MFKTKIVFFGTKGWEFTSRHLQRFLAKKANIVLFIEVDEQCVRSTSTKKESFESISNVAKRLDIPIFSYNIIKSKSFVYEFLKYKPDVIVVCGYQFYIPPEILNIPIYGAINFHSSLLPRHAGMHPVFWTIWYGDKRTGMTLHFMNEGIDTGDIIYTSEVSVFPGDTIEALYDRIIDSSMPLVDRLVTGLEKKRLPRIPQDMNRYLYNYDIVEKDFELDWRQPADVLEGRVKMLPGKFYFFLDGGKYYIEECESVTENTHTRKFKSGIPFLSNNYLYFPTPRGFLRVISLIKDGNEFCPLDLIM